MAETAQIKAIQRTFYLYESFGLLYEEVMICELKLMNFLAKFIFSAEEFLSISSITVKMVRDEPENTSSSVCCFGHVLPKEVALVRTKYGGCRVSAFNYKTPDTLCVITKIKMLQSSRLCVGIHATDWCVI